MLNQPDVPKEVVQLIEKFEISKAQISDNAKSLHWEFIEKTLFILPMNDLEAMRSVLILEAIGAQFVHNSQQGWGALLEKEDIPIQLLSKVKNIVIFEIPGVKKEQALINDGYHLLIIDHHHYNHLRLDRSQALSSLEQLCQLIGWQMDELDKAIAINDRSYIPGLKAAGISESLIRDIQIMGYLIQGRSYHKIIKGMQTAKNTIKSLPQQNGVYILKNKKESRLLLLELAIESPNGVVNVIEISKTKIGFSGSPKVVQALLKFDFTTMGYQQKTFKQFGGGDVQQSMYFAFIPKTPPSNYKELIPPQFEEKIVNDIFNCIL
ncbi:MAG: hypothetical protein ABFS56_23970 [Pseudomonadota bacterium]